MSDRPIQVGDLVRVYRIDHPCIEFARNRIGTVDWITETNGLCSHCQTRIAEFGEIGAEVGDAIFPFSWLKRIDPPSEGETTEAYQGIPATREREKVCNG